jgi:hypothetical protein
MQELTGSHVALEEEEEEDEEEENKRRNNNSTSSPYSPGIITIDTLEVAIQSDSISPTHVLKCHRTEITVFNSFTQQPGHYRQYLQAGRSGVRTPVGARPSVLVHIGPEAHHASRTMGTESLSRA